MKILGVTSGKGGVGKSTLSLNIARQLSLSGKRTLLVDFDIHNKGITNLFLPKILPTSPSVTAIVATSAGFSQQPSTQFIQELKLIPITNRGELFFLPASRPAEMMEWQHFVANNEVIVSFFQDVLGRVGQYNNLDVIVIDCYGGIDSLTIAAAGIADDTIIVNEPDIITFGGTLTLYTYLLKQYEGLTAQPRLHFVINRISKRHSFKFLNSEYRKNLAKFSVDKNILGYFPYDKLLLETFGDYPFFTELLPRGLFTCKIRLMVATMWRTSGCANFVRFSPRRRKRVLERTSETGFADPEAILRAVVNLPFLMIVPVLLVLILHFGVGHSLHYWTIAMVLYTAGAVTLLLIFLIGVFEPFQISRWLFREATYRRRKRNLQKKQSAVYRFTMTAIQTLVAFIPGLVAVTILFAISYFIDIERKRVWNSHGILIEMSIWPGEIDGLNAGGHYEGIRLNAASTIKRGGDLSGAHFSGAHLYRVRMEHLTLKKADFDGAFLPDTSFRASDLSGATFHRALLESNFDVDDTLLVSGADFENALFMGSDPLLYAALTQGGALNVPQLLHANRRGRRADEEYAQGAGLMRSAFPDMIEALILKGTVRDLVEAKLRLGELEKEIQLHRDYPWESTAGEFYMLDLIYLVISHQPAHEAADRWCDWLQKHGQLHGWEWDTWDLNLQKKNYSAQVLDELSEIEASAKGVKPNNFCNELGAGGDRSTQSLIPNARRTH